MQLALVFQSVAQVVVGLTKIRLELQRPAEAGNRFVRPPNAFQRLAEVILHPGVPRIPREGPAVGRHRLPHPPLIHHAFPRLLRAAA